MRLERGTWLVIGWLLLLFGGWARHAQAQEVPSKDVGKSVYYIPVFPGGKVNLHPFQGGNLKYTLPLFKNQGVGPCTAFTLTYNTDIIRKAEVSDPPLTYTTLGWIIDYHMRIQPSGQDLRFTLPTGDQVTLFVEGGTWDVVKGYGFTGRISPVTNKPWAWSMVVEGGTVYRFNPDGRLRNIVDPTGCRIDIVYADGSYPPYVQGRIVKVVDMVVPDETEANFGVGRETTISYWGPNDQNVNLLDVGFIKSITDANGNSYLFTYTPTGAGRRLGEMHFPPVVVDDAQPPVAVRPVYKFRYGPGGILNKVTLPKGDPDADPNEGYEIEYSQFGPNLNVTKVTDPEITYIHDLVGETTGSPTLEISYQQHPWFNGQGKPHTEVTDRRGNPTVYVFQESSLRELWDPLVLPEAGGADVPGISPMETEFDLNFNLIRVKDRWGHEIRYEFYPTHPSGWAKNLLRYIKKDAGGGDFRIVEEFTYTQDEFANIHEHYTYTTLPPVGLPRKTTHHYDSFGRLTQVDLPNVTSLPDADDQIAVKTKLVYGVDGQGRPQLVERENERGNSVYFSDFHVDHGLPETKTREHIGGTFKTSYDLMGNVTGTRLPQGGLPGLVNEMPGYEELTLDALYRVEKIKDPRGDFSLVKGYDLDGHLRKELPAGDTETSAQALLTVYDLRGNITGGSGPDGSWSQKVDANGNIRERTNIRGHTTQFTYDKLNRLKKTEEPGGSVGGAGGGGVDMITEYLYDDVENGKVFDTVKRGVGGTAVRATKTFYDSRHRKQEVLAADNLTSTRLVYDERDQVVATELYYNGSIQSATVTLRDERDRVYLTRTQSSAYQAGQTPPAGTFFDVVTIPNKCGTIVEERGPLWTSGSPAHSKEYVVDEAERVVQVKDGFGVAVVSNFYGDDDLLSEVKILDPVSKSANVWVRKEARTYTKRKELMELRNAAVVTATYEYTVREGVVAKVTNAAGIHTTTSYYDNTWRVDEVIIAEGTNQARNTKSFWTNGLLTELQVWNSAPNATTPSSYLYFYDEADRLEKYQTPNDVIAAEITSYTEFGEVTKIVAGDRTIDFTYDALGRLKHTQRKREGVYDLTEDRDYGPTGLLKLVRNDGREETTTHDVWKGTADKQDYFVDGVKWKLLVPDNEDLPALDYFFDNGNFLKSLRDPHHGLHVWDYDANGRLTVSSYGAFNAPINPVCTVTYTPGGLIDKTTIHASNGDAIATTTFTYDSLGRRKRQRTIQAGTGAVVSDLEWGYDSLDLVTSIKYHHLGVESTLLYNKRNEVEQETITSNNGGELAPPFPYDSDSLSWSVESALSSSEATVTTGPRLGVSARTATYVIDPAGNRTSQTINGVTTTFEYNSASQLRFERRMTSPQDLIEHEYDAWGNEVTRTTNLGNDATIETTENYQYNELNLLSSYLRVGASAAHWEYAYWPGGARFRKTDQDATPNPHSELYILKMGDVAVDYEQVGDGDIEIKNTYVQGVTTDAKKLRIAASDGARRHYIGDAVGTLAVTLTDAGAVEHTAFKDVFGVELSTPLNGERYTGLAQRERDSESGLDYLRTRMYDPRVGRFTQADPILSRRPHFHYAYASGNPASRVDPDGKLDLEALWEGVKATVAEPFRAAADVIVGGVAVLKGWDLEDVEFASGTANATKDRIVVNGESNLTAVGEGGVRTGLAIGTFGISEEIIVTAQYLRGEIGIDEYDRRMSALAGGMATGLAVSKVTSSRPGLRQGSRQGNGGNGRVMQDGDGATPAERAASQGGSTGGSRSGQPAVREALINQSRNASGQFVGTCWRCGARSTNPADFHLGHRNCATSAGGNLNPVNVALEGAACNLSAGNRGMVRPGMDCASRGGPGAPYGRNSSMPGADFNLPRPGQGLPWLQRPPVASIDEKRQPTEDND